MVIFRERREGDAERFEDALKDAKRGIKEACEIFEDMKEQFSERGTYSDRYSNRGYSYSNRDGAGQGADGGQGGQSMGGQSMGGGMSNRDWDDWDDYKEFKRFKERRRRDSLGRFQ